MKDFILKEVKLTSNWLQLQIQMILLLLWEELEQEKQLFKMIIQQGTYTFNNMTETVMKPMHELKEK